MRSHFSHFLHLLICGTSWLIPGEQKWLYRAVLSFSRGSKSFLSPGHVSVVATGLKTFNPSPVLSVWTLHPYLRPQSLHRILFFHHPDPEAEQAFLPFLCIGERSSSGPLSKESRTPLGSWPCRGISALLSCRHQLETSRLNTFSLLLQTRKRKNIYKNVEIAISRKENQNPYQNTSNKKM